VIEHQKRFKLATFLNNHQSSNGFSLLSATNFTEHLNNSLALLRICMTNCLERHFCQVLLHTVCLREAKFQLCVLVGGLVSVTSTAGGSSSGVDESGYELQRSLCPLPPPL
jgi:hypothetical protein